MIQVLAPPGGRRAAGEGGEGGGRQEKAGVGSYVNYIGSIRAIRG